MRCTNAAVALCAVLPLFFAGTAQADGEAISRDEREQDRLLGVVSSRGGQQSSLASKL